MVSPFKSETQVFAQESRFALHKTRSRYNPAGVAVAISPTIRPPVFCISRWNPSISSTNVDSKSCITFLTSSSMTCIHLRTSDTILYSSPNPQKSRNCCVFTASHTVHHRLLSQWRLQFDWPSFPHPIGHSYSFCYRPIVNPVAYSAYFQQLINTMKALRKPHRNSNTIAP